MVCLFLWDYTASYRRRISLQSPPWEPEISQVHNNTMFHGCVENFSTMKSHQKTIFPFSFFVLASRGKSSPATRHEGAWGERRYSSYSFLTSALDGGVVSVTPRPRFTPGERTPGTHCTGGWVGLRAGLDTEATGKILCPCRGSNLDRPVVQPVARHYTDWATRLIIKK
jgi:hypothetical protein